MKDIIDKLPTGHGKVVLTKLLDDCYKQVMIILAKGFFHFYRIAETNSSDVNSRYLPCLKLLIPLVWLMGDLQASFISKGSIVYNYILK
jgi:hypothetical protein